jgi:hypothetical protein
MVTLSRMSEDILFNFLMLKETFFFKLTVSEVKPSSIYCK